jgi:hypothetical protein
MRKTRSLIGVLLLVCAAAQASVLADIPVPAGCARIEYPSDSFARWIRSLPLKSDPRVKLYDGNYLPQSRYSLFAVLDVPLLFRADLEQCADFCMRLWADYHKAGNALDRLYLFSYDGGRTYFRDSGKAYAEFLRWAFSNANSYSLKRGCSEISRDRLAPGDLIVQNDTGGIGHVSMIMDACSDAQGRKLFLMGFSFMPAQEFHVEKAPSGYGAGGWFDIQGYLRYLSLYYDYGAPGLRRF